MQDLFTAFTFFLIKGAFSRATEGSSAKVDIFPVFRWVASVNGTNGNFMLLYGSC